MRPRTGPVNSYQNVDPCDSLTRSARCPSATEQLGRPTKGSKSVGASMDSRQRRRERLASLVGIGLAAGDARYAMNPAARPPCSAPLESPFFEPQRTQRTQRKRLRRVARRSFVLLRVLCVLCGSRLLVGCSRGAELSFDRRARPAARFGFATLGEAELVEAVGRLAESLDGRRQTVDGREPND